MSMSPPFPSFAFVLHVIPVLTTSCGLKGTSSFLSEPPVAEPPVRRRLVGAVSYTEQYSSCQASRQCSSRGNTGTVDFDMMTLNE
ncbi:hypothetical protein B0H19DRAFT_1139916 [Mycena capillaripes]|nr:hypothetical protein B0H19DRAFT_1139916 [Mycena capillaripes]